MSQSDEPVIVSIHFLNNNNKWINTFKLQERLLILQNILF